MFSTMSGTTNMSQEDAASVLVNEMGFNRAEVILALEDNNGDFQKSVQNLLAGKYKPPPYQNAEQVEIPPQEEVKKKKMYPDFKSFFKSKKPDVKSEKASAPSIFDSDTSGVGGLPQLTMMPPPYEKLEREIVMKDWEIRMGVEPVNDIQPTKDDALSVFSGDGFTPLPDADERCAICFSALTLCVESVYSESKSQIISQNGKKFHRSCFTKKYGPKCAYCCFALDQEDKDHELSGKYLKYKGKDYHVECYEKYAGPRCNYCFNVIIEKPNGEFSGNWVVDKNNQYHVECLQRKMFAAWRAKHS